MHTATLIKGKTYTYKGIFFDASDPLMGTRCVDGEIAEILLKTGKFEIDGIKIISKNKSLNTRVNGKKYIEIAFLISYISQTDGYGCLGAELAQKYPTSFGESRDGLKIRNFSRINLNDMSTDSNIIQLGAGNSFKDYKYFNKNIGYTMFETTKIPTLPNVWVDNINKTCDLLLVPAKEVKKVFANCGVTIPIEVVPLWVNDIYQYVERPKREMFKFLWAGTLDGFNRKGWLETIEAFKAEFKPNENVNLIMKTTTLGLLADSKVKEILEDNRISFVKGLLTDKEFLNLFESVDCFVFPTHGEGFGLPPLEAMATGLPTIATDWMGCAEFVNDDICYPIKVKELEKAVYDSAYGDVGEWAKIDIQQIRELMRYIYENREEAKLKGLEASKIVNQKYRLKNFDENLHKIIKDKEEEQKLLKLNLVCEGLMFGHSGFAEAVRNMVCFLHNKGCNIMVRPHDNDNIDISTENGKIIKSLIDCIPDDKYKTIHIVMTIPLGIRKKDNDYQIGYVMFETQEIPKIFINSLMVNTNELWVPSTFNFENFIKAGYNHPIFVMPLGVDTDRFSPDKVESLDIGAKGKFTFLSIVGWSERKGVSTLIEAYLREFSNKDNTILYIKGGSYDSERAKNEVVQIISKVNKEDSPEIKIDFNLYSDVLLPKLYKSADCFVLASLGEGWGLNYTEAMSMRLPTIGTRCTGQIDFMTDENSFLIDVKGYRTEPRCDWISPQYAEGIFAIPSMEHLQQLMRQVYANPELAKEKGMQAREDMINKYQWKYAADKWWNRLKELEVNL